MTCPRCGADDQAETGVCSRCGAVPGARSEYSCRERVLPCGSCGASVTVPVEGGTASCGACGAALEVGPRPDTTVSPSPASDETARIEALRRQIGRPMAAPQELLGVLVGGEIEPWKVEEARAVWEQSRKRVLADPSDFGAAERLLVLTVAFTNVYRDAADDRKLRGMLEGALEALTLPRHRQFVRGLVARRAARRGDPESAEEWLSGCDPASDDLMSDSSFRLSVALVATARGDPSSALAALGIGAADVPFHDSMTALASVLRAGARERSGDLDGARALLVRLMAAQGVGSVDKLLRAMPAEWRLCAGSFAAAREERRRKVAASAGSGEWMGWVTLAAGCVPLLVIIPVILFGGAPFWMAFIMPIFTLSFGGWGLKSIRAARRSRLIAQGGEYGTGRILAINRTGTTINDVPLMRLDLEVTVPGRARLKASATKLIDSHVAAGLLGQEVGVIWHPGYPAEAVLEE